MPFYLLLWSIKLDTYTETMQGGKTATTFSTEDFKYVFVIVREAE